MGPELARGLIEAHSGLLRLIRAYWDLCSGSVENNTTSESADQTNRKVTKSAQ